MSAEQGGPFVGIGLPAGWPCGGLFGALDRNVIFSVTDATGRIVHVNELFCHASGYTRSELLGASHRILKSGTHPPPFYRELWATIASGRAWHGEIRNRRKSGDHWWLDTTILPVADAAGRPLLHVSIQTDITARKLREEELEHWQRLLHNVAEASGQGVLVEDEAGLCVYVNQRGAYLLGCETSHLRQRPWRNLVRSSVGPVGSDTAAAPATGAPLPIQNGHYEGEFIGLDGRSLPVLVSVQSLSRVLRIPGRVIAFHDHTEELRQREVLRQARASADRASQAKSAFLANMSHEIRTPLNAVLGLARMALDEPAGGPRLRQYLHGILESADALTQLITDVLDLSKIEAGKLLIERVDFNLHDLLRAVHSSFSAVAGAKQLELLLTIAPDVPRWVNGDALRVRQIVSNFLGNAIKFTPQGRVHLQATMAAGDEVRLAVADTGIGIDPKVLGRLFRPFVQADESTTREYGGSGLGLSICRALAEEMGGRIGADSEPGQGSVFWAELPLPAAAAPESAVPAEHRAQEGAGQVDLVGMRVLLVEDNEINRMIAAAMLEHWGIAVTAAQGGREALECVDRSGRFDLVLMDLHMPGMSGYDVTAALRSRHTAQELPIVALTAAAFEGDRERCLRAGMNDFVTKPIQAERLRATLAKWKARGANPRAGDS